MAVFSQFFAIFMRFLCAFKGKPGIIDMQNKMKGKKNVKKI